jgi:hypothetical protein
MIIVLKTKQTNTRPIKELFQLMLNHTNYFSFGLCQWVDNMYYANIINLDEETLLKEYITNHRPLNFKTLFNNPYYWEVGKIEPRIRWIKKHIEKNS